MTGSRVVVLDDTMRVAKASADWSALGAETEIDFVHEHVLGAPLEERLRGAEIIVAMRERTPLPAELLAKIPGLRLIVTTGMRNASIDVAAAMDRGIVVCGTRGVQTSTAEMAWALILGLVRGLVQNDASTRSGGWQRRLGGDLSGRKLGLVGLGKLGTRMARIAKAFEMDVVAWSPHLTQERADEAGVLAVDKETLFRTSDVVSIHLVLAESTRGIVGAAELAAMSPDAFLVNASRAALVDGEALKDAVLNQRIAGVGLDVYDEEPLPAGTWMADSDRVLLSPHMGYVTRANYELMYGQAVEDIVAWRSGNPVRLVEPHGS